MPHFTIYMPHTLTYGQLVVTTGHITLAALGQELRDTKGSFGRIIVHTLHEFKLLK